MINIMIVFNRYSGSCNFGGDLSTKICASNETKIVNAKVLNMITRIIEANLLIKHISCDCKCKFDSTACNSNQKWNNGECQCDCKKCQTCK